jgi:hypothetical protein
MNRQINFEQFEPPKAVLEARDYRALLNQAQEFPENMTISLDDPNYLATMDMLFRIQPSRINYTQKEAAKALNMSYHFVNSSCRKGMINTISYGGRKLITVYEIARLILKGVGNVSKTIT